ncbi:curli assembly protein CsgF [Henriciella sp. AS95]|uniref:curli assembly protein CsgF n=1 Tax=Henriciella sp. AS95 TaxID=3135782 RepID=UPI003179D534
MRGRLSAALLYTAAAMAVSVSASAQELVYEPINPSFGGDSFNSSHLLGTANAQNDYKDPDQKNNAASQSEQFVRQLQSRLLSSLAGEVNEAIFGDNPQDSGTITFGDQIIEFYRGLDSVQLTITDLTTGAVTEIEIPLLYAGGSTGSSSAAGPSSLGAMSGLYGDEGRELGVTSGASITGEADTEPGIY